MKNINLVFKVLFLFVVIAFGQNKKEIIFSNDQDIEQYKNMFNESFQYLQEYYVDSINQSEIIKSGIKGMLKPLDPYTKLVVGSSKDRLDMLTKGKYGGVGIRIGSLRDTLTVLSPMEDSPAYSEGIKAGDQIIKIDSVEAIKMTTREASKLIKGELGSKVVLHIRRPGYKKKYSFELVRSNITVQDVPYWHIDENSIGYIRITRFSRNTYEDFIKALREIDGEKFVDLNGNSKWDDAENYRDSNNNGKWDSGEKFADKNKNKIWDDSEVFEDQNQNGKHDKKGQLKGLIIDLRGNSGGLLNESISILNTIIDKGETLLYTKGRNGKVLREYKSTRNPVLSNQVPIIVLVNKSSASASEIISGVIQDLDRGVIMGRTTFGKGLVQKIKTLNDTVSLKITNAKYYIPSGRLIQKQDWLNNGYLTDGLNIKDSIFYTIKMNREVKGGGGVSPDIETKPDKIPSFINALWKEGIFLSFSSQYIAKNNIEGEVNIDDDVFSEFKDFLYTLKDEIIYKLPGEKELDIMREKLLKNSTSPGLLSIFNEEERLMKRMDKFYKKKKSKEFKNQDNKEWMVNGLEKEFSRILSGEQARIGVSLKKDVEYKKAVDLLLNLNEYYSLLGY